MNIETVILAAGKGTRMYSALPKVLHRLSAKPLLEYVLDAAEQVESSVVHVVHGHGGDQLMAYFAQRKLNWVHQNEQKGTGHAVALALPDIPKDAIVLVLYGDVPMIEPQTLLQLTQIASRGELALLTIELNEPGAMGRIIRDDKNQVIAIKEYKDASEQERQIKEINTGFIAAKADLLSRWLGQIDNNNAQQEYYLTDIVSEAVKDDIKIQAVTANDEYQVKGINSRLELAQLQRAHQLKQAEEFLSKGLMISDPARFDLNGSLKFGRDCQIETNVVFEGDCELGDNVTVGANCIIKDTKIANNTVIEPFSLIENALVSENCSIGPYARIRPGTQLEQGSRIGNFVEVKNSIIGPGSKANHLSYIGDAQVGRDVNIGAGMITCNYDGANKHKTIIGDNVHVGSDCQLVAPVTVSDGATIAAGTTIYKDAPQGELSLNKKEQIVLTGWVRPTKNKQV